MGITNFPRGVASWGIPVYGDLGIGNVYYVCQTTNTTVRADMEKRYGKSFYEDGSAMLHSTIQSALDACVAARNDYVVLASDASDYDLTAVLTMTKKSVHLIAPSGMGLERGSTNGVRIHQTADAAILNITGANCEVAGIYFKNYNNKPTIYGGASGADCLNVHNCHFNLNATTTNGVPAIDCATSSGASFIKIWRNTFATNVSDLTFSSIVSVASSCTWASVCENNIMIGDGCTATVGIQNLSYKGETHDNYISELEGGGGAVGTITTSISIGGGTAFNNRIANNASNDVSGGGTDSFQGNTSGASGGSAAS